MVEAIKQLFVDAYCLHHGPIWDWDNWSICYPLLPRQSNPYDCGVFMCMYVLHLAMSAHMTFFQDDMPRCRIHMAQRLMADQFFVDGSRPCLTTPAASRAPSPQPDLFSPAGVLVCRRHPLNPVQRGGFDLGRY